MESYEDIAPISDIEQIKLELEQIKLQLGNKKAKYIPPAARRNNVLATTELYGNVCLSRKKKMALSSMLNREFREFKIFCSAVYLEYQLYNNVILSKKILSYIMRTNRSLSPKKARKTLFKLPYEIFENDPLLIDRYKLECEKTHFINATEEHSPELDFAEGIKEFSICHNKGCNNTALKYKFANQLCIDCYFARINIIRDMSPGICVLIKATVPGVPFSGCLLDSVSPGFTLIDGKINIFAEQFDYKIAPFDKKSGININCGHPYIQIEIENLAEISDTIRLHSKKDVSECYAGDYINGYIIAIARQNHTCLNSFYGICKSYDDPDYSPNSFKEDMFLRGKTYISKRDLSGKIYRETGKLRVGLYCRACYLRNKKMQ